MMKAIAIDDEPPALELIDFFCKKISCVEFEKGFTDSQAALVYIEQNEVDLLFLDINMPATSGITFYNSLLKKPMLIFTTSYAEYALESYDLNALDYLLKPFTFERFEKAIIKARQAYDRNSKTTSIVPAHLTLKADYGVVKILLTDILFVESLNNYLKIHLKNTPPLVVRLTMKTLLENLDKNSFLRVHRSYIVAVDYIQSIKHKLITVAGKEIPVGRQYEKNVKHLIPKAP